VWAAAVEMEAVKAKAAKAAKAAEAEGCIRGSGMHWMRRNASEERGSGRS
jgi:hypothetical protein